ncbi:hypothetical protein QAD02_011154 [Eretmocerus hayati]|uniref:Uncharacterized protein n=1 Tax=Eretmocerus hayati TaxID=131215 RepID=A0ACC2NVY5_9HYME|nr:hypothetical protein QAD02_011154 [Eretmocerus hayati]
MARKCQLKESIELFTSSFFINAQLNNEALRCQHWPFGILPKILTNRLLDPKGRRSSGWLGGNGGTGGVGTRKPSQDSSQSSSRNDSSGCSGCTGPSSGSTSTWRISHSSGSLESARTQPLPCNQNQQHQSGYCTAYNRPRLTRQMAIQEPDSPNSPARLAVRLLATIPSAAEMSEQLRLTFGGGLGGESKAMRPS